MPDEEFRQVYAELTQDGTHVTIAFKYRDTGITMAEMSFPPERGYQLAQNITLKCIQCEETTTE